MKLYSVLGLCFLVLGILGILWFFGFGVGSNNTESFGTGTGAGTGTTSNLGGPTDPLPRIPPPTTNIVDPLTGRVTDPCGNLVVTFMGPGNVGGSAATVSKRIDYDANPDNTAQIQYHLPASTIATQTHIGQFVLGQDGKMGVLPWSNYLMDGSGGSEITSMEGKPYRYNPAYVPTGVDVVYVRSIWSPFSP